MAFSLASSLGPRRRGAKNIQKNIWEIIRHELAQIEFKVLNQMLMRKA